MFLTSTSTARPGVRYRPLIHLSFWIALASACNAPGIPHPEPGTDYPVLRPGDSRIARRRPTGAECFEYVAEGVGDTGRRVLGPLVVEWAGAGATPRRATWLRTAYARQTEDTMVYDAGTLAPRREDLRVGDRRILLRYRGATVERMVQQGDSIGPSRTVTFDHQVFGFNQREELLRVTRLLPGDTLILPLYSEIDADLELDTLSLAPDGPSALPANEIRVRFADPAIVAIVTVDTSASTLLGEEIRNRRRAGRIMRTLLPPSPHCAD